MSLKYLPFVLLLCSCSDQPAPVAADSLPKTVIDSDAKLVVQPKDSVAAWPQGDPVNIIRLKALYGAKGLLSGVVAGSANTVCGDTVKGFRGQYYFLDSLSMKNFTRHNTLVVFKPGKPEKWMMEATDETFVSIELETPYIHLWDSLYVGMKADDIPITLIHTGPSQYPWSSVALNGYDVRCKIEKGVVTAWEVSRECKN